MVIFFDSASMTLDDDAEAAIVAMVQKQRADATTLFMDRRRYCSAEQMVDAWPSAVALLSKSKAVRCARSAAAKPSVVAICFAP